MSLNFQKVRIEPGSATLVVLIILMNGVMAATQIVPAIFVFGDSLIDVGNNNYLIRTLAKGNYFPYGIDFDNRLPTGRFSNGKTFVDFLAKTVNLSYPPPSADPNTAGQKILGGVNFASAAAGILDQSGQIFGERFTFNQQILNFKTTLNQLRTMLPPDGLTTYLSKSIAVFVIGTNDYILNYLSPVSPSRSLYTPLQYSDLLINSYSRQLNALYDLGLRKFFLAGIGPLGCMPYLRNSWRAPPGRCLNSVNEIVRPFNERLKSLVDQMNTRPGAITVYGNTYGAVSDLLNNPANYGMRIVDRGCCGIWNQRQITCLPISIPCGNRNEYFFWDAYHPTEHATAILFNRAFSGSPADVYPINIQAMILK